MNNVSVECPFVEGCKLVKGSVQQGFIGKYFTVWLQDSMQHEVATLEISRSLNNQSTFHLEWKNQNGILIFVGEGMLFEKLLVACYWMN